MAIASNKPRRQQEYSQSPFLLSAEQVRQETETSFETGLSSKKAHELQNEYGENTVKDQEGIKWFRVLGRQASNAMILVLVLAMALSYGISDYIEGGVVTAIILLNIIVGFFQEYRAEQKIDALRRLASPSALVLRDGRSSIVPSSQIVPGDIVQIKTGDAIPADLRLFEAMNLECDEKILTGEAVPVSKDPDHDFSDTTDPLVVGVAERINCVYSSSVVTRGRGQGVVIYTGMYTEIGKIANSMQNESSKPSRSLYHTKDGLLQLANYTNFHIWSRVGALLGLNEGTPLQKKLSKVAYMLLVCALVLAVIVFSVSKYNFTNQVAIYAISVGIAIIPESLIAVLTLTMVVGSASMARRKVLVRKLDALEALGGVTYICSDKTGTLTQGQMTTRKAWIPSIGMYTIQASGNEVDQSAASLTLSVSNDEMSPCHWQEGKHMRHEKKPTEEVISFQISPEMEAFVQSAALCNLASVQVHREKSEWQATGDPTEVALQMFATRFNYGKQRLEDQYGWKKIMEYPFDSSVKRMSVVYKSPQSDEQTVFTKGGVEYITDLCSKSGFRGKEEKLTQAGKEEALHQMRILANQGLRVLAIARRILPVSMANRSDIRRDEIEHDLTLLGLAGLYDPPRHETRDAVKECNRAGIRVIMLTGDHVQTASAIAKEIGIVPRDLDNLPASTTGNLVETAADFDRMTNEEIDQLPALPLVVARCTPETKTRMIRAIHRRQGFAAMTGDGVNDAPSLKAADIGVAMGMNGSDVAKSASDIILTDDNFASIVNAIEEGRRMFDNIQKFILHLLTSNVGEVILLIFGLAFRDGNGISVFPLSPLQILWINMITSSFPAFGLGREQVALDVMTRKPHDLKQGVFTLQIIIDMLIYGALMGVCTLATFITIIYGYGDGNLGVNCNERYTSSCDVVFRARAAVFAELTWLILVSAWEFKSIRCSLFQLGDGDVQVRRFTTLRHLYKNRFLFWAVVIGALSVFPVIYISGLNTTVFKHKSISWEWTLVLVAVLVFLFGVEVWKFVKRSTGWFDDAWTGNQLQLVGSSELSEGLCSFAKFVTTLRLTTKDSLTKTPAENV